MNIYGHIAREGWSKINLHLRWPLVESKPLVFGSERGTACERWAPLCEKQSMQAQKQCKSKQTGALCWTVKVELKPHLRSHHLSWPPSSWSNPNGQLIEWDWRTQGA